MRLAACASRRAPFCAGPRVRRLPPPPRPRLRLCPGRALGVVTLSALVALSDSPEEPDAVHFPPLEPAALSAALAQAQATRPSALASLVLGVRVLLRAVQLVLVCVPLIVLVPLLVSRRGQPVLWRYVRWALETLGGAWIKLGQWASTRPDIFSAEVVAALATLCRTAPAHAASHSQRTLEHALHGPLHRYFAHFDAAPVASGAVAQVHAARLHNGEQVAVKVLHPAVATVFACDLALMHVGVTLLECLPGMRWLALSDSLTQFSQTMRAQLDLRNEALNLIRFNSDFAEDERVIFARPLWASEGVLVQSWEAGVPLPRYLHSNAPASERRSLARLGLHMYLRMMLEHNFVHADLHPGNIAVRHLSDGRPALVLYDVGLTTEATETDWEHFKQLFRAIVVGNGAHGAELMIRYARRQEIQPHEREAFKADMDALFSAVRSAALRDVDVGAVLRTILALVRTYRVQIEGNFATLCVSTAVLEGIGRQLDPEMNLLDEALPFFGLTERGRELTPVVTELGLKRTLELLRIAARRVLDILRGETLD